MQWLYHILVGLDYSRYKVTGIVVYEIINLQEAQASYLPHGYTDISYISEDV